MSTNTDSLNPIFDFELFIDPAVFQYGVGGTTYWYCLSTTVGLVFPHTGPTSKRLLLPPSQQQHAARPELGGARACAIRANQTQGLFS